MHVASCASSNLAHILYPIMFNLLYCYSIFHNLRINNFIALSASSAASEGGLVGGSIIIGNLVLLYGVISIAVSALGAVIFMKI